MELVISKRNFLRGLARTHGVADRKSSMPILSNILLTTDSTTSLRFAATDLYLGVAPTATAEVKKGGSIAVSARTLFEIQYRRQAHYISDMLVTLGRLERFATGITEPTTAEEAQ